MRDSVAAKQDICTQGDLCLDVGPRELLKNFRSSLIDPDTPASAKWRRSADGKPMKLVVGSVLEGDDMATTLISLQFSDEFNVGGRTFYPNEDAYWYAEPFSVIYFFLVPAADTFLQGGSRSPLVSEMNASLLLCFVGLIDRNQRCNYGSRGIYRLNSGWLRWT